MPDPTPAHSYRSDGPGSLTVGSLQPSSRMAPFGEAEAQDWTFVDGDVFHGANVAGYTASGTERITYNNPYVQEMERVWFDGKVVFAIELGEINLDVTTEKVAQEYQIVYAVELDEKGKYVRPPELVPGQLNIYDSVPGMDKYSPLWQFNYVVVPRSYGPNSFRSERDCLTSGYPIVRSTVVEN